MKSKLKLFFAFLLLFAFLADSCGHKSAYSTPKKGKHSRGGKKIKTEMGGYL